MDARGKMLLNSRNLVRKHRAMKKMRTFLKKFNKEMNQNTYFSSDENLNEESQIYDELCDAENSDVADKILSDVKDSDVEDSK